MQLAKRAQGRQRGMTALDFNRRSAKLVGGRKRESVAELCCAPGQRSRLPKHGLAPYARRVPSTPLLSL